MEFVLHIGSQTVETEIDLQFFSILASMVLIFTILFIKYLPAEEPPY